jgi:hypothetical protein
LVLAPLVAPPTDHAQVKFGARVQINTFQRLGADLNGVDAADAFVILRDGTQVWAVDALRYRRR